MQPFYKNSVIFMGIIAASAALTACGGSGGSSSGASTSYAPAQTGKAIDFYLAGSNVYFTDCPGQTTVTDANGNFKFPAFCSSSAITVSGGTDIGTNLPFYGVLKTTKQAVSATPVIVSVLTTLIASGVDSTTLATQLGLTANLLTLDPMTNVKALQTNVVLQQLLDQVSAALVSSAAANGQSLTVAEAESKALAALVTQLGTTSVANITDSNSIAQIITNAATAANFSNPGSVATANSTAISNSLTLISNAFSNATLGQNGLVNLSSVDLSSITTIESATDAKLNAAPALNNYIQLNAITLNNSGTSTPINNAGSISLTATGGLTDVQVALASVGSPFGNGTSTVNAALSYTINGNTANLIINNIQLAFSSAGVLTGVTVASGSSYSYSLTGASNVSGSLTSGVSDNLFTNGNLDLSVTSFLSKLHAVSGQDVAPYTPKTNDNVVVALAMSPVKVGTGSGSTAVLAPTVTIKTATATLAGQGVNAQVAVN
jgi:hypothetical protein